MSFYNVNYIIIKSLELLAKIRVPLDDVRHCRSKIRSHRTSAWIRGWGCKQLIARPVLHIMPIIAAQTREYAV